MVSISNYIASTLMSKPIAYTTLKNFANTRPSLDENASSLNVEPSNFNLDLPSLGVSASELRLLSY
jgi:hypothetical protein